MASQNSAENLPATRAEFYEREDEAWRDLCRTWRGLPEEALVRPGASGPDWSVKDVMNHLAAWQEAALRVTQDLMAGRWGSIGASTDRFNAQRFAEDRGRSLAATRRRLSRARRELLAHLSRVPARSLLNPFGRQQIGWWAAYSTYAHYAEHLADSG